VVEFILERVTNIAMGTEIDNVVEFEEVLNLPLDEVPSPPKSGVLLPV
jgi:tartronate-semialdehyde synthase